MPAPSPSAVRGRRPSGSARVRRILTAGFATAVAGGALLPQAAWAAAVPAGSSVAVAASVQYPTPTKAEKDLAHQQLLAQERASHVAAAEAKAAAEKARASAVVHTLWSQDGEPTLMTVIGPTKVYIVQNGNLELSETRPAGTLSALWLAENLPDQWFSWPAAGVARLDSALVITDGSSVFAGSADLATLQMGDHSSIWIARGTFAASGITITSLNPTGGGPLPSTDPSRPFIRAAAGAALTLDGTTVIGLGNAAVADDSGITWGKGATGHAIAVKVNGGYTGLRLASSTNVQLQQVTVTGSTKDGLVLENDTGTTLTSVTSEQNGGDGIRVDQGPKNRTIHGVTTSGDTGYGIDAKGITGLTIDALDSTADASGGVELIGCVDCAVTSTTTLNDRVGVKIARNSSHISMAGDKVTGGVDGIVVGSQAAGVTITGITVSGTGTDGIDVSGQNVSVSGGSIGSSGTGIQIGPTATGASVRSIDVTAGTRAGISVAADNATISDCDIQGGGYGIEVYLSPHTVLLDSDTVDNAQNAIIVAKGATAVRILKPTLDGSAHTGITNSSADLVVLDGRVHGGGTGIDTQASMSLTGTRIDQVTEGLHIGGPSGVTATGIYVLAEKTGIDIASPGKLTLTGSRVLAPIGIKGNVRYVGTNVVTLPPFPWLGGVAIAAIILGFILEALHATRQPKRLATRDVAPDHVLNVA